MEMESNQKAVIKKSELTGILKVSFTLDMMECFQETSAYKPEKNLTAKSAVALQGNKRAKLIKITFFNINIGKTFDSKLL